MRTTITGTGLWHPSESLANEELVDSFNRYVEAQRAAEHVATTEGAAPEFSDASFIEKASGVERRYVVDRGGILDPDRLRPRLRIRSWDEHSLQCEMSLEAANQAIAAAGCRASDIDLVIAACSNLQRPYPAIAIEVQTALGARGFAYDMNVACSTATFAIQAARNAIEGGTASRALVVSPELCTGFVDFRDRDSHFIFGDACSAVVIEPPTGRPASEAFEILGTSTYTRFSNSIRNDGGFLSRAEDRDPSDPLLLFKQNGRKVFREVSPLVVQHIRSHLERHHIAIEQIKRLWRHRDGYAKATWESCARSERDTPSAAPFFEGALDIGFQRDPAKPLA